jgi:hypothetical protein
MGEVDGALGPLVDLAGGLDPHGMAPEEPRQGAKGGVGTR